MKTTAAAESHRRRHPRRAREHVLRRRALPGGRRLVRAGAQDRSEGRQRQHRSRHRVLLHEPAGPGARAVRPIPRDRSRPTPRRCSTSASSGRSASRISRARPRCGRRSWSSPPRRKKRGPRGRRSTALRSAHPDLNIPSPRDRDLETPPCRLGHQAAPAVRRAAGAARGCGRGSFRGCSPRDEQPAAVPLAAIPSAARSSSRRSALTGGTGADMRYLLFGELPPDV